MNRPADTFKRMALPSGQDQRVPTPLCATASNPVSLYGSPKRRLPLVAGIPWQKLGDSLQHFALGPYRIEQLSPRLIERLGALRLQIRSKLVEIDPCVSEIGEDAS